MSNLFRQTRDGSLDRYYLRTCAIYRLLKSRRIDKAGALALARRPIKRLKPWQYAPPKRLDATIEIWLKGPLRDCA
jgi:hypothetical protein